MLLDQEVLKVWEEFTKGKDGGFISLCLIQVPQEPQAWFITRCWECTPVISWGSLAYFVQKIKLEVRVIW